MELSDTKRLIKYGFLTGDGSKEFKGKDEKAVKKVLEEKSDKDLDKFADEEMFETIKDYLMPTGYPKPDKHYRVILESADESIERYYYFFMDQLKMDYQMRVEKIVDTYAATEASSYFGMLQQRLSIQQQNVSGYLKTIAEMVKGLYQMVRELQALDLRLELYYKLGMGLVEKDGKMVNREKAKDHGLADMTLKDIWVSQVEGGTKNPGSVFGLANTVGFTILPDVFFKTQIYDETKIEEEVKNLKYNGAIKMKLQEKLQQHLIWRKTTFRELETRKSFSLKHLRQHYDSILLYISWVKPYLRYIKKLQGKPEISDNQEELISSFEGTFLEIEVLARRPAPSEGFYPVVLLNLQHRVRPENNFSNEYQKGPIHVGKTEVNIRSYCWTQDQINNYKKFRIQEDIELLSSIDESLKEALKNLGDDLQKFLEQQGEKIILRKPEEKKEEPKKEKPMTIAQAAEPFTAVFSGFGEIFGAFGINGEMFGQSKENKDAREKMFKENNAKAAAIGTANFVSWQVYKNYKKAHRMLTW